MRINPHYAQLAESYLFTDIARRLNTYKEQNPTADIIRLGIGDVTRPLAKPVIDALHAAVEDMAKADSFHGYGPEQGYSWLREAIAGYYARSNVKLELAEIFISDGAKSDIGNIIELFEPDNIVLIPDPVYPAYVDANVMGGRTPVYISGNRENNFLPLPDPAVKADIIYLCSPNNPTGAAYTRAQLAQWVAYATAQDAVILFDAAYECFITSPDVPHSIFEIEGAAQCAIEICSLSKTAGFTGTRCGYTVVPKALVRNGVSLNAMWNRRQTTKFNETSYIIQRGAQAVFTPEGHAACLESVDYYRKNAGVIAAALDEAGVWYSGGVNSPYIWMACPAGLTSWEFFDILLQKGGVVGTPGAGFGVNGEGYFRLTGFGEASRTAEAASRLKDVLRNL